MARNPKNPERAFGVSVGAALCAIAALLVWRGHASRASVVGAIGSLLLVAGLVSPRLLRWPSAAWWAFSRVLGYVNFRILLTFAFVVALTPMALLWRAIGKDPMGRRRDQWSGWSPYPARYRDPDHYLRMY